MKRIKAEPAVGPRGFSAWIHPKPTGYLMACCDCGLVHEMDFRVIVKAPQRKDGVYRFETLPPGVFGVRFRARRANGHTRRQRRKKTP